MNMKEYIDPIKQTFPSDYKSITPEQFESFKKEYNHMCLQLEKMTQEKNSLKTLFQNTASSIAEQLKIMEKLNNKIIEQEERFRMIINFGSDVILLLDKNGRTVFASESITEILGYSVDEYLNISPGDEVHPEDKKNFRKTVVKSMRNPGKSVHYEGRFRHKNGSWIWIAANGVNFIENSVLNGVLINFHEITHRKIFEKSMMENEERLSLIVDENPDAIVVYRNGIIVFANQSAVRLLKAVNKEQLIGLQISRIVPRDQLRDTDRGIDHAFYDMGETTEPFETKFICLDNKVIDVEVSNTCIVYGGKDSFLTIIHDIGGRKRIERLREDTERIIRHDLKNPLNGIIGFSQLLLQAKNPSESNRKDWASAIYSSGHKMLDMINNSLDLFKMEEGTYRIKYEDVDLFKIFDDLEREFITSLENKSLVLICQANRNILEWEHCSIVPGQKLHLRTLFSNLLKNAIEAAPAETKITVNINARDNIYQEINIHNMGAVPESVREHFFERYSTAGKSEGTGIGTYSAYLITRTHGGHITFTSSEADGTCVTVLLPKAVPA